MSDRTKVQAAQTKDAFASRTADRTGRYRPTRVTARAWSVARARNPRSTFEIAATPDLCLGLAV